MICRESNFAYCPAKYLPIACIASQIADVIFRVDATGVGLGLEVEVGVGVGVGDGMGVGEDFTVGDAVGVVYVWTGGTLELGIVIAGTDAVVAGTEGIFVGIIVTLTFAGVEELPLVSTQVKV